MSKTSVPAFTEIDSEFGTSPFVGNADQAVVGSFGLPAARVNSMLLCRTIVPGSILTSEEQFVKVPVTYTVFPSAASSPMPPVLVFLMFTVDVPLSVNRTEALFRSSVMPLKCSGGPSMRPDVSLIVPSPESGDSTLTVPPPLVYACCIWGIVSP